MRLLSWNIQWCRGMDGRVDPARIAREAKAMADPDVCCFQEVAAGFDTLAGSAGEDQFRLLADAFPGYTAHAAWAVDTPGGPAGRRRFGNLILSRLPVRQVFRHSLPCPPEDGTPGMPRAAVEAVVDASWGPVSITTTHLEYYSAGARLAQAARLVELARERGAHARTPPSDRYASGPFQPFPRPAEGILSGDFNMRLGDPAVDVLRTVFEDGWTRAHPGRAQPATFGCYDAEFASEPYCCDFIFVTPGLAPRLADVRVNGDTRSSDHQPVIATFR